MVGDININFFDYDKKELVKNIFNMIFQSGFLPYIQRATMHSGIIKANI